jgi:hypothetical protein
VPLGWHSLMMAMMVWGRIVMIKIRSKTLMTADPSVLREVLSCGVCYRAACLGSVIVPASCLVADLSHPQPR